MEQLQTRTEHSRSLEDADRLRAIHTLTELGLLIPLTEIETYHGRVKSPNEAEPWFVNSTFNNGGNDSGNLNVNERPTLYTGDRVVALEFAEQRSDIKVRPLYMERFKNRVERYTEDEKKAWLDRLNQEKTKWWASLSPEVRDLYHSGPDGGAPQHTVADLEKDYEIYREAQAIENSTPDNVKKFIWDSISKRHAAEVHDIVSGDSDATVINFSFDAGKLSPEESRTYNEALKAIALDLTEGSPVGFDDRGLVLPFISSVSRLGKHLLTPEDIEALAKDAGVKLETAMQLGSAFNTRQACLVKPAYLADLLLKNRAGIVSEPVELDGIQIVAPFNLDYFERYLREAHIVGVRQAVISATLNKQVESVSLFDLEKVNTEAHFMAERADILRKMGSLAGRLEIQPAPEDSRVMLLRVLEDPHVKPENLVKYAQLVEGHADTFSSKAGNWEGFTLGQHTETVLRNFDENFADTLPVELLAPMRLLILGHDLGKPKAAADHAKHKQKEYNLIQAADFYSKLDIPDDMAGLLLSVIGDGAELIYQAEILGDRSAKHNLRLHAVRSLKKFNSNNGPVTGDEIEGYVELCRILLTCDGGAYTSMAVTRRPGRQGGRFRNSPSFNYKFARPNGLGKRRIKLAGKTDAQAPGDLTPKIDPRQSNIRVSHRGPGRKAPKFKSA